MPKKTQKKARGYPKIFFICFAIVLVFGFAGRSFETDFNTCQGFTPFGCASNNDIHHQSSGYGTPFDALSVHASRTVNGGAPSSSYKRVDWSNLLSDLVVDAVLAAIAALPVSFIYKKLEAKK